MKVIYTRHALRKFKFLQELGWKFQKFDIARTIRNPDYSASAKKQSTRIALKKIDSGHDLRVVYTKSGDIITVITFYPTRRGRYEKE